MQLKLGLTILLATLLFSCSGGRYNVVKVKDGVVDLEKHNFLLDGKIRIEGSVNYYPDQFLTIDQINSDEFNFVTVNFPAKLSSQLPNNDAKGYGTYHFKIRLPQDDHAYGMFIEGIFTSYKLIINDQVEDEVGKIGTNIHSQKPMVRPEIVNLHLEPGYNDVLIQVSNFYENQTQLSFKIEIGEIHGLYRDQQITYGYDLSFSFFYLLLFIVFLMLFIFNNHLSSLYFSIYCFVLSYRFLVKNSKFLLEIFDANWTLFYKSEFVTYYLTSSLIPIILCEIYKVPKARILQCCLAILPILFSVFTFFANIPFFTKYTFIYHFYSIILVLFSVFITLYFHFKRTQTKYWGLVLGVVVYAACFLYDVTMSILYYKESYFYNWGLTILSIIMAGAFIRIEFFKDRYSPFSSQKG